LYNIFILGNTIKEMETDSIMINKKYDYLVKKHTPKEDKVKYALIAFIVGGLLGVLGEALIRIYIIVFDISRNDASTYMIITFIFFASLFTALGFFDKLVSKAKAGLLIPITGFAHSMMSAALDYKYEGPIYGIGSNVFKLAGSVIFYGVVSAWFFGLIRYLWEVLV
jgi:hypothetical protein